MKIQSQENLTPETTKIMVNPSDAVPVLSGNVKVKFTDCLHFLDGKGKQLYGPHFRIHAEDYEILYKLLIYFARDEEQAQKWDISLRKGIMLAGPVGCGKTTLLTLYSFFLPAENRFIMKTCRDVSFDFHKHGYDVIQDYSKKAFHNRKGDLVPKSYCFDDLGVENNLKHFGNECNVMGEILLSRYEMFVANSAITHLTTNLSAQEIEKFYGLRVRSRLREMLNLLSFEQITKDKR
jgi:ABC-type Fe3+/spermidine/putrescine transport system ATPase subunit